MFKTQYNDMTHSNKQSSMSSERTQDLLRLKKEYQNIVRKDSKAPKKDRDVYSETVSKSPERHGWNGGGLSNSVLLKNSTPYTKNNLTTNGSDYAGNGSNKKRQGCSNNTVSSNEKQQNVLRTNNGKQSKNCAVIANTLNNFGPNHKRAKSQSNVSQINLRTDINQGVYSNGHTSSY